MTIISDYEFKCGKASSIKIPGSVVSIGNGAYFLCKNAKTVTIPKNVANIGEKVFSGCHSLETIIVNPKNTIFDSRDNCNAIIETATNTLREGCGNTVIPDTVVAIGKGAFYNRDNVISVSIPESVNSIREDAFSCCENLTTIYIPKNVSYIGNSAFSHNGLSSIIVDKENETYDSRENCNAIIETATNTLIVGCKNTVIPASVTAIAPYAFCGCKTIESITLPDKLTRIGTYAFAYCRNLKSIAIPEGVKRIEPYTFVQCNNLTSVTIPAGLEVISTGAFENCRALKDISVPESVRVIGDNAFFYAPYRDSPELVAVNNRIESEKSELREKYYGQKNIAIIATKYAYIYDAAKGKRNKEGFLVTENGELQIRNFLMLPGETEDSDSYPEFYFDFYNEVLQFGTVAYVIDEEKVYYNSRSSIRDFNQEYGKRFSTFDEIYDYAVTDNPDDIDNPGLAFSASVVEDAEIREI